MSKYYIIPAEKVEELKKQHKQDEYEATNREDEHYFAGMRDGLQFLFEDFKPVDFSEAAMEENIEKSLRDLPKGIHVVDFEIGYKQALKNVRDR